MPFDQWYDDATREAATARVLQRAMTNPTDRNVLTVVAEEFNVPRKTLGDWVEEASPGLLTPARKARRARPKFSAVVRTTKVPVTAESPDASAATPARAATDADAELASEAEVQPASDETIESEPQPMPMPMPEAEPEPERDPTPELEPASDSGPVRVPDDEPGLEPEWTGDSAMPILSADDSVTALEAEVASLRSGNRALVEAMRVVIDVREP